MVGGIQAGAGGCLCRPRSLDIGLPSRRLAGCGDRATSAFWQRQHDYAECPGEAYSELESNAALVNNVSEGLFETLGIPLVAGRTFELGDMRKESDAVIVDAAFVQQLYPHQNPLGRQIRNGT